jgi:hypothetical protein
LTGPQTGEFTAKGERQASRTMPDDISPERMQKPKFGLGPLFRGYRYFPGNDPNELTLGAQLRSVEKSEQGGHERNDFTALFRTWKAKLLCRNLFHQSRNLYYTPVHPNSQRQWIDPEVGFRFLHCPVCPAPFRRPK